MKRIALIGAIAATMFAAPAVFAQAYDGPPPPEVIATLTPVYHEGHAAYWYHGYWHYRDGRGGWTYYHSEPTYFRDYRGSHATDRHHYGRR